MIPEVPSPTTREATEPQGPKARSVGWQLVQVAVLAALLLGGMYEVDLDARALAEKRARTALLLVVDATPQRAPSASAAADLEQAIESYAKVCVDCASSSRCEEAIRSIRVEKKVPEGRGPCKEGIFERWSSDEIARSRRAP